MLLRTVRSWKHAKCRIPGLLNHHVAWLQTGAVDILDQEDAEVLQEALKTKREVKFRLVKFGKAGGRSSSELGAGEVLSAETGQA